MAKVSDAEDYLSLWTEGNPCLCHFFTYFTEDRSLAWNWSAEILGRLRDSKIRQSKSEPLNMLLLTGALKLVLRDKPEPAKAFLGRVRECAYEETHLQPLSDKFFDKDSLPDRDTVSILRRTQLSSPRKFLLDLCVLEGLGSKRTARLLGISEPVLEAHLYTILDQLMGHPAKDPSLTAAEELTQFVDQLNSKQQILNTVPFHQRMHRLLQGLRIDFRDRFEEKSIYTHVHSLYPQWEPPKEKSSEPSSMIEAIRRQNEIRQLQEKQELENSEADGFSTEPWKNQVEEKQATALVKPALAVIVVFFCGSIYKTINPVRSETVSEVKSTTNTMSLLQNMDQFNPPVGFFELNGQNSPVRAGEFLRTSSSDAYLKTSHADIVLEAASDLRVIAHNEFHLDTGSIKITVKDKEKAFACQTSHGRIEGKIGSYHLARHHPDYSTAGVVQGELTVDTKIETTKLQSGTQMRFGQGLNTKVVAYNPTEYRMSAGSKSQSMPSLFDQGFLNQDLNDSDLFVSKEKLLKIPEIQIKDFLQDL
ncbi:MAG: hypothetical protein H3C47_02470 [Candidatus Cloacimonetes bacterium]|nr:hypothetical protein [Candidatus Cloacimonadota bacterium]